MTQTAPDDVRLLAEPLARGAELPSRLREIRTAEIAHLHALEVPPNPLLGIDLWRVAGEALQVNPRSRTLAEELLDCLAAVDRRTIPDDQQLARDVTQQMLQEANDLGAPDRRLVDLEVELLVQTHGPDHREMIMAERVVQNRRLAHRSVSTHHRGQQVKATLIDEEQRALLLQSLLF